MGEVRVMTTLRPRRPYPIIEAFATQKRVMSTPFSREVRDLLKELADLRRENDALRTDGVTLAAVYSDWSPPDDEFHRGLREVFALIGQVVK